MSSDVQHFGPDGSILTGGVRITGTMVNYYLVCPRKLWLHSRNLGFEDTSELVMLGSLLHESSFAREKKEILILGQIRLDHTTEGTAVVVHEVKKTGSQHEAARAQLLFYLLELEFLGIKSVGELHFRSSRQKQPVVLDEQSRTWIRRILADMIVLLKQSNPPPMPRKAPCKRCAYRDYCEV